MSYDPDALLDRRRLRRRLRIWQGVTVLALLAAVLTYLHASGDLLREDRIARLHVEGLIVRDEDRNAALAQIAEDPTIRGLVVHVDSPGGTVVGGEDLFRGLRAVSEAKPVAAVMGSVATSAAYMASVAADRVFAREGTITGSIGVILQSTDFTGLLAKLGIQPEAIKSSPLKAQPNPLEPLSPAARQATQAVVTDIYDLFVDMVAERRGMSRARTVELADGRIYTGRQALKAGLIDGVGGEMEARQWLASAHGIDLSLPGEPLRGRRDDGFLRDAIEDVFGKTLFSERLRLDGLISLWHPEFK